MITITFLPSLVNSPPFQTVVTLDGVNYQLAVTWNIYGQRWYVTLTDQSGNVKWVGPMIGSPLNYDVYVAPGIFTTSTLLYREDTGNFEVGP